MATFRPRPDDDFDPRSALDRGLARNAQAIGAIARAFPRPEWTAGRVVAGIMAEDARRRDLWWRTMAKNLSPVMRARKNALAVDLSRRYFPPIQYRLAAITRTSGGTRFSVFPSGSQPGVTKVEPATDADVVEDLPVMENLDTLIRDAAWGVYWWVHKHHIVIAVVLVAIGELVVPIFIAIYL